MPARLHRVSVTPKFELFYALFAVGGRQNLLVRWKSAAAAKLGNDFAQLSNRIAPSAYMWPLLADALRTHPLAMGRDEIIAAFRSMDDRTFQCDVLGGLFKRDGIPESLIEGGLTLRQAVANETTSGKILEVIGLKPFHGSHTIATAIQRVISDPQRYRADVTLAIEKFWDRIFGHIWESFRPVFERRAKLIATVIDERSLGWCLEESGFPITVDERRRLVSVANSPTRISFATLDSIQLFPSAFNFQRFWANYDNREGKKTLYIPVLHPEPIPMPETGGKRKTARDETETVAPTPREPRVEAPARPTTTTVTSDEAKAGFIALGDKTRFAMASMLARSPQTSVELARAFGVSKPTISHHVQLFRAAGLLKEKPHADGVILTIDRERLEALSSSAAKAMFEGPAEPTIQRTRRTK